VNFTWQTITGLTQRHRFISATVSPWSLFPNSSVQANSSTGIKNRADRASSKPFVSGDFVISERLNTFNNTGEMDLDAFTYSAPEIG
jgi:hypothetical protein